MSRFLTELDAKKLEDASNDGRGTWRLDEDLVYQSDAAGKTIIVPKGFVTDMASVPRVPIAFWLAGDTADHAAVVHDWLYTSHEVPRDVADAVLREASLLMGVPPWRAAVMYWAVRAFGGSHWDAPSTPQPDHIVPFTFDADRL